MRISDWSSDVCSSDLNSQGEASDDYTKVGGAAKIRAFNTVVKVGDVFPSNPVVAAGDSRLLPESFTGVTATNTSIDGLTVQAGRSEERRVGQECVSTCRSRW